MPERPHPDAEAADRLADLRALAADSAEEARTYLATVADIASGTNPSAALPLGLLALSQVLVMGARLGAIEDIVPEEEAFFLPEESYIIRPRSTIVLVAR